MKTQNKIAKGRDKFGHKASAPENIVHPRSSVVAFFHRMPTTTLVIAPYVLLFLPPAFIFGNSSVWFLIRVLLIALLGTVLIDLAWPRVKPLKEPRVYLERYDRRLFYLSFSVISLSTFVGVLAAIAGKGSVAVQTGRAELTSGFIVKLDSLTGSWEVLAVGLIVACYFGGQCTKKEMYFTLCIGVLGTAIGAIFTQITAPLFNKLTFLAMFLLFLELIKFRAVLFGIFGTLVIWPTVYEIRNQLRLANGVGVSEHLLAFDRLRFDTQFARAQEINVPLDDNVSGILQNPGLLDILRFGLIPRFLDPDRDIVSTGLIINMALGGTETSAYTFGPVTTVYVLGGALYLLSYYAILAVVLNLVWQGGTRITPIRLTLLGVLFNGPLGWLSTQPDTVIGAVQSLTASIPLFIALMMIRTKSGTSRLPTRSL